MIAAIGIPGVLAHECEGPTKISQVHQPYLPFIFAGWETWYSLFYHTDFKPTSVIFAPHQYNDIVISDLGIIIWLSLILGSIYLYGFGTVFRTYLAPYLWLVSYILGTSILLYASNRSRTQGKPLARPDHIPPTHRPPPSTLPLRRVHLRPRRALHH